MKLVWKLLRKPISLSQITGFMLANIIGTTIILLSIQFYNDIKPVFSDKDSFIGQNYIVATKKVNTLSSFAGKKNLFSKKEIEELKSQKFCNKIGVFTPSLFKVYAGLSIKSKNIRFGTDLFFESVPNDFIDVPLDHWHFNLESKTIPIILPKNYLNLYNFGFAESRNLPKLSEGMISMIQLDIELTGNGKKDLFKGNIIGFSNRLNTILVPQQFIDWANNTFSIENQRESSRIILEVDHPSDPAIANYFQSKGYDTESGALDESKTTYFLNIILIIILFIGLLISLLSLYILLLSLFLLIQKSTEKIKNLQLIGYTSKKIALPYQLLMIIATTVNIISSIGIMYGVRSIYVAKLQPLIPSLTQKHSLTTPIIAFLLLLAIIIINSILISQKIKKIEKI